MAIKAESTNKKRLYSSGMPSKQISLDSTRSRSLLVEIHDDMYSVWLRDDTKHEYYPIVRDVHEVEVYGVTNYDEEQVYVLYSYCGCWGLVSVDGKYYIPKQYDSIRPVTMYGFEVELDEKKKFFDVRFGGQVPTKEVLYIMDWLESFENHIFSKPFERFYKYALGMEVTISSMNELKKLLSLETTKANNAKIDSFFGSLFGWSASIDKGEGNEYDYDLYNYTVTLQGFVKNYGNDVNLLALSKKVSELGKKMTFETIEEFERFFMDVKNEEFCIKNFNEIFEVLCE